MTLTREDVLRELDLLPVWQLRQAMPIAEVVDMPETKQAIENEEEVPHVKEVAPVAEKVAMPWVLVYDVAQDQLQAGQTLLQNIIKAMRLPQGEFVTLTQLSEVETYQAGTLILFGQANVDNVLKAAAKPVESLRGQHVGGPCEGTQYWVTYGLDDMLATPSLKAAVWQDVKAAMQAVG